MLPQVYGPDGVLRDVLTFNTSQQSRFFTGTAPSTTIEIQVSVRSAPYTGSSDWVAFDGETWTVPNPEAFPDGLELDSSGTNTILVRAVLLSGSTTSPCTISVNLVPVSGNGTIANPPTNVSVAQEDQYVQIQAEPFDQTNFRGLIVYASLFPGGGSTGYTRVSVGASGTFTTLEELRPMGSQEVDVPAATDGDGSLEADPQFVQVFIAQVDDSDNVLQQDLNQVFQIPEDTNRIRTTVQLDSVRVYRQYYFNHSRSANVRSSPPTVFNNTFANTPVAEPLYYVTTSLYFDPNTNTEIESPFSAEVAARPLNVTANVGTFPVLGQQQIVRNVTESIFRSNPQVSVQPGSYIRDVFIDPFAAEADRLSFAISFLHAAQSFASLLQIDDPNNTGVSIPVPDSPYKQALRLAFGLASDSATQQLIDQAFENLAGNFGVYRRPGQTARGLVRFFTTRRPTSTLSFPIGTTVGAGSLRYRTTQNASIPLNQLASYFDPTTNRYQVDVSAQAVEPGSASNVAAGQIRQILTGPTNVNVINASDFFGGKDRETNKQLATRALNALASVDTGTKQGYLQVAADTPGVIQASVVASGEPLMIRDIWDGQHRGGKVDVWVRGDNTAVVSDTFAFEYEIAREIQFSVVGDPADLMFRANDPLLSQTNPIIALLDNPGLGLSFRNATTGEDFDLTAYTIVSFDTVQLSTDELQPEVTLTDVVLGDYRRRATTEFTFLRQPVVNVESVTGTVSGTLSPDQYQLVRPIPAILEGRSVRAQDKLDILADEVSPGVFIPAGTLIAVSDEAHVLTAEYIEYLDNLGADPLSVVVTSEDGTVTYRGPNDPSGIADYTIIFGTATVPVGIRRVPTGDIVSGQTVLVSYAHDENFTVRYGIDNMVRIVQETLDVRKNLTADVLAKAASPIGLDLEATVILRPGSNRAQTDNQIRSDLTNYLLAQGLGVPVRASDIVAVIDNVPSVSYVAVPLTRMSRSAGSLIVWEDLSNDNLYLSWSNGSVSVWLLTVPLTSATSNAGGPPDQYRNVFQDEIALQLVESNYASALRSAVGQCAIIGQEGLSIPGYSDDATLLAAGFTTPMTQQNERARRTGNRVIVTTAVDDSPFNHTYNATYIAATSLTPSSENIDVDDTEYVVPGDWTFTYDEDVT